MRRRSFLTAVGTSVLAGCSASEPTPTPGVRTEVVTKTRVVTPTPTPTPSPTPTPTKTPEVSPEVEEVNLLSDWTEYGDVIENRITSISPSEPALVGARFWIVCSAEREVRWNFEVTVENSDGDTVARESTEEEDFTSNCADSRRVSWEQYASLWHDNEYGSEWPLGEYRAFVWIDDYYGAESARGLQRFSVEE